ncbi:hypothetical protein JHK86_027898 [Glycine max]|nr:hypothetical protein JHK86_027898 [Glycine max]
MQRTPFTSHFYLGSLVFPQGVMVETQDQGINYSTWYIQQYTHQQAVNEDHKRVSSCQEIESPQEDAVHGHVSQDSDTAMESTRVMWIKREECSFVCLHMAVKGVSCEALRYGKLQGLNKQETAKRYGKEKVHEWHKSFDIPPPKGESLEMCS